MTRRLALAAIAIATLAAAPSAAAPGCRSAFALAEGSRIGYRDCGDPAAAPLILIPGGPGLDAGYVAPLADMIARLHHRVIVVEPRGTGASRAALGDGTQLTVAGSVADIEAVRRAAGVERPIVLGHSFGGSVAQAYAAAFPERIRALVLMDSAGPGGPPPQPVDGWRRRADTETLARYDALRAQGDRVAAMRIKFRLSFVHQAAADRFLRDLSDDKIHMDVMPLSARYDRDFRVAVAAQARFPVTLMAGRSDWIRGYEPALKQAYPNARLFEIPDAGHFPWVDAPASTRRALKQALAD